MRVERGVRVCAKIRRRDVLRAKNHADREIRSEMNSRKNVARLVLSIYYLSTSKPRNALAIVSRDKLRRLRFGDTQFSNYKSSQHDPG